VTQGCHEGQGYLFGRPMISDDVLDRLKTQGPVAQRVA
jgi:EAL domain-containing protein (putative c-di-GMP-specific phosphodiesterase class I)